MNLIRLIFSVIPVWLILSCAGNKPHVKNYYFDPIAGNDSINTGTSPDEPFKSLSMITKLSVEPGDSILLKSGSVFMEPLYISCSGDSIRQIVIGKYGGVERPWIMPDSSNLQGIHVFNSEYITIRDLEISNTSKEPVAKLTGVLVELVNFGTAHKIVIDNLYVHDINGSPADTVGGGYGIRVVNYTDEVIDTVRSRFDGLLIQNCLIKDVTRDGIMLWGNWIRSKWFPSLKVIIRNNMLDGIPGHGIVPVGCLKPLVEYNIMKNCPDIIPVDGGTTDGIWPWGCDSALIQFNVVSDITGRYDGFGFDSDYNCQGSIFQYNLSYNNAGGFLLICNPGGWPPDWCIGNSGTIIRYNISINDGIRTRKSNEHGQAYFSPVINVTGPVDNTLIEKNLFLIMKKKDRNTDRTLVHFTDWRGYSDSTLFRNNYIFSEEEHTAWKPSKSTNSSAENNSYSGILKGVTDGFIEDKSLFESRRWYDRDDKNWDILLAFLKDKEINMNGEQILITDLLNITND